MAPMLPQQQREEDQVVKVGFKLLTRLLATPSTCAGDADANRETETTCMEAENSSTPTSRIESESESPPISQIERADDRLTNYSRSC